MVLVTSGIDYEGKPYEFYLDGNLKKNLDGIKEVVNNKDMDYVTIVCGDCGVGKSNFAQHLARYCDENFDEKQICFTADQFIEMTNNCKRRSAIILDESFQSFNSKISMSSDFVRIVNHLQLIRQKNLYIFLCLPNFFDLNKGIALFRCYHLFYCYSDFFGDRGRFAAFGKEEKKNLYILGGKFINYNAVRANFIGKFTRAKFIKEEVYLGLKHEHLMNQEKTITKTGKHTITIGKAVKYLSKKDKLKPLQISEILGISLASVYTYLKF